jgi:N-methylhydantoinase A/oxoprolinase/acetone carboxylase beta subunit
LHDLADDSAMTVHHNPIRIGADAGGTFTDVILLDGEVSKYSNEGQVPRDSRLAKMRQERIRDDF